MKNQDLYDDIETWRVFVEWGLVLTCVQRGQQNGFCNSMVLFSLGDTAYGIPLEYIRDIQLLGAYTPLPFTHPCIVGVVNRHEWLLAVLDIRPLLLRIPVRPPHSHAHVLIVKLQGMDIGLLVDELVAVPSHMRYHRDRPRSMAEPLAPARVGKVRLAR
jgi:chemotaxis signal transduction protein